MDSKKTKSKSQIEKELEDAQIRINQDNHLELKDIPETLLPKLNQLITSKRSFYEALNEIGYYLLLIATELSLVNIFGKFLPKRFTAQKEKISRQDIYQERSPPLIFLMLWKTSQVKRLVVQTQTIQQKDNGL